MKLGWTVMVGTGVAVASACLVEIRDLQPIGAGGDGGVGSSVTSSAGGAGGSSGPCPADMVHITDPDYAPADYCIDRYEVTQKQYAAFLVAVGNDVGQTDQPSQCASNMYLQQEGAYCPSNRQAPNEPVNCVDWCDAWAYCHHYGKRLCGSIADGGALALGDPGGSDEWEFACSNGLRQRFPYGDDPELCTCYFPRSWEMDDPAGLCGNTELPNFNIHVDVGSMPGCEGGYTGLFDMTGNIAEWTNRCESDAAGANCVTRGGFTFGSVDYDDCNRVDNSRSFPRINNNLTDGSFDVGVRCCSDPQ